MLEREDNDNYLGGGVSSIGTVYSHPAMLSHLTAFTVPVVAASLTWLQVNCLTKCTHVKFMKTTFARSTGVTLRLPSPEQRIASQGQTTHQRVPWSTMRPRTLQMLNGISYEENAAWGFSHNALLSPPGKKNERRFDSRVCATYSEKGKRIQRSYWLLGVFIELQVCCTVTRGSHSLTKQQRSSSLDVILEFFREILQWVEKFLAVQAGGSLRPRFAVILSSQKPRHGKLNINPSNYVPPNACIVAKAKIKRKGVRDEINWISS